MAIKKIIKGGFEKLTGYKISKSVTTNTTKVFGVDPYFDIQEKIKGIKLDVFFDVGANIGQAAKKMRKRFPTASIHCFEPIKDTFEKLKANTKDLDLLQYNCALGSKNEQIEIVVDSMNRNSDRNSLNNKNVNPNSSTGKNEKIEVKTLDGFCAEHSIKKIDYLKVDTEGFDLEVLKGSVKMLEAKSISFVETEVSMNPTNTFHITLEVIKEFMESKGYYLFGIYEQVQEWETGLPILRRTNALFISMELAKKSIVKK